MNTRSDVKHIVVLGGGYAGLMAISRLRPGQLKHARISLIDSKTVFEQRIRFHEALSGRQPKTLAFHTLLRNKGVQVIRARVSQLKPEQNALYLEENGQNRELRYDYLVYAPGSYVDASLIPGADEFGIVLNRSEVLAKQAHELSSLPPGSTILIAGCGLSGIETAAELATQWPHLTIRLSCSEQAFADLAPEADAYLRGWLTKVGIDLIEHCRIARVTAHEAVTDQGETLAFDRLIVCCGFDVPRIAEQAGVQTERGRVVVDDSLRSVSHRNIIAVGDAASVPLPPDSDDGPARYRMGCVCALPMGAHAGENLRRLLTGKPLQPFSMAFMMRCISLGRHDGIIQMTNERDRPLARIKTGKRAARIKEWICKMTFYTVQLEIRFKLPFLYWWPKIQRDQALPANARIEEA